MKVDFRIPGIKVEPPTDKVSGIGVQLGDVDNDGKTSPEVKVVPVEREAGAVHIQV